MSRRISIELTSARPDGSFTWRAAGAREPRGVVESTILPAGAKVGDELKVEVEQEIDGITVLSVLSGRAKSAPDLLELLPSERPFEPVTEQRARRDDRGPRRPRRDDRDGDRRDRRDRPGGDRGPRGDRPGGDRGERGDRPGGDRGPRGPRPGGDDRGGRRPERRERPRPSFTPPPELPQRPKPKRLRPGSARRTEVLAGLPEEQRPIAELALQGMPAVRQRLREDNVRLRAEGKPEMPEASVLKLAEELLPRLRVAEWLDRAEAAQRQLEHLDLRDLRSVVAASDDPVVARDESSRELAETLKAALVTKQDRELELWREDIDAALGVGRVIRALRLSSQPPKAGVPFPGELAHRLAEAATASLTPVDGPDRWSAVLEAAAFSPVRAQVTPSAAPEQVSDELRATVTRLAPALPQVAALFGIEVAPNAAMPKPLRPQPRAKPGKPDAGARPAPGQRPAKGAASAAAAPADEPTPATTDDTAPADEPTPATADTAPADEPTPPATDEPSVATDEPTESATDEPTPAADEAAPADEPSASTDEPSATAEPSVAGDETVAGDPEPVDDPTTT